MEKKINPHIFGTINTNTRYYRLRPVSRQRARNRERIFLRIPLSVDSEERTTRLQGIVILSRGTPTLDFSTITTHEILRVPLIRDHSLKRGKKKRKKNILNEPYDARQCN